MKTLVLCCVGDCGAKFDAGLIHGDGRDEELEIRPEVVPAGWILQSQHRAGGAESVKGFWCPKCRTDLN